MGFKEQSIAAAQSAIDGHVVALGLEDGCGPSIDLYHLLCSILEWSDAHSLDFDATLSEVRSDTISHTPQASGEGE